MVLGVSKAASKGGRKRELWCTAVAGGRSSTDFQSRLFVVTRGGAGGRTRTKNAKSRHKNARNRSIIKLTLHSLAYTSWYPFNTRFDTRSPKPSQLAPTRL
jgi:hypothetical protein